MDAIVVFPPDGTPWTIAARPLAEGGVRLVIAFELSGRIEELPLDMDRPGARQLIRAVSAASGDGTERTFTRGSGNHG